MKILQKRSALRLTVAALAALLGGIAFLPAGAADNATASATAVVLTPIGVTKNTDMVFGNLLAGNGDVTVSTSGARTKTGGTVALLTSGATPAAARFDVTGTGTATFAIDYTGSTAVLTSGGDTMAIAWISEVVATSGGATGSTTPGTAATGTLTAGAAFIFVGGVLTVDAAQAPGTYTGSVKVTVAYN